MIIWSNNLSLKARNRGSKSRNNWQNSPKYTAPHSQARVLPTVTLMPKFQWSLLTELDTKTWATTEENKLQTQKTVGSFLKADANYENMKCWLWHCRVLRICISTWGAGSLGNIPSSRKMGSERHLLDAWTSRHLTRLRKGYALIKQRISCRLPPNTHRNT